MKKHLITGTVLASFAFICALLLALVNMLTEGKIKAMEEKEKADAIASVYKIQEGCTLVLKEDSYGDDVTDKDSVVTYYVKDSSDKIIACIYQVTKKGFASDVVLMISINKNHEIVKYTVVSEAETRGDITPSNLFNMEGMKELDSFDNLTGNNFKKLAGSSVSSKAVWKCFNTALYLSYIDMPSE